MKQKKFYILLALSCLLFLMDIILVYTNGFSLGTGAIILSVLLQIVLAIYNLRYYKKLESIDEASEKLNR
ncbi:hypothetical protein [Olivibacter ginsenosidimutans]